MSSNKDLFFSLFLLLLTFLASGASAVDEIPSSMADLQIRGAPGDDLGSVLAIGDINCDNVPDLFLGAPGFSFGADNKKSSGTLLYGIFGPIESDEGVIDLSTTRADLEIISKASAGTLGLSIELADLNNDGCDDLIVGDPQAKPGNWPFAGEVNVLFGRADAPSGWIVDWSSTNLPDLKFINDLLFLNLGEAIGTGDFNGDGNVDIFMSGVPLPRGIVYVVFGPFERSSGSSWDLSSDSADLQIVGNGVPGPWYNSDILVSDFNGDGNSDLFLGTSTNRNIFNDGDAYIFFGRPASTLPDDTWNMLETPADVTIHTSKADSYRAFGHQVLLADLNGGGKSDLLVADPWYTIDLGFKGAMLLFEHHRLSSGTVINLDEETPDQTIVGRGASWFFFDQLAVAKGAYGDTVFATSPYFSHDQLILSGTVFRMDSDFFTENGDYIKLDYTDPSAIYYGASQTAMFGSAILVEDLDDNESLDLIVGGKGDNPEGGIVYIFYDQVDTTLPEDDDDADDDDSSTASGIDVDIDKHAVLSLPDEEGGCRCGY